MAWRYIFFLCIWKEFVPGFRILLTDSGRMTLLTCEKSSISIFVVWVCMITLTLTRHLFLNHQWRSHGLHSFRIFLIFDEGPLCVLLGELNSLVQLYLYRPVLGLESALHETYSRTEKFCLFQWWALGSTGVWVRISSCLLWIVGRGQGTQPEHIFFPQVWARNGTLLLLMSQKSLSSCSDSL